VSFQLLLPILLYLDSSVEEYKIHYHSNYLPRVEVPGMKEKHIVAPTGQNPLGTLPWRVTVQIMSLLFVLKIIRNNLPRRFCVHQVPC
jgi:hypothetical protein